MPPRTPVPLAAPPAGDMRIEYISLDRLVRWPRNAKDHDLGMLSTSMREFGFVSPIIIDETTGRVVAGHGRIDSLDMMRRNHQPAPDRIQARGSEWFVPVIRGIAFGSEQAAAKYLLADNQSTILGGWNDALLAEALFPLAQTNGGLLGTGFDADDVDALRKRLEGDEEDGGLEPGEIAPEGVYALSEDAVFPSSNQWHIPDLLPDRLSNQTPHLVWGRQPGIEDGSDYLVVVKSWRPNAPPPPGACLAFYAEDEVFEKAWDEAVVEATRLHQFQWGSILTPDFSTWWDMPRAIKLYNVYRARWVARYWQELGFSIIPSVQWSDRESRDFLFLGIPEQAPVVSLQCRTVRRPRHRRVLIEEVRYAVERLRPQTVLVYGGADHRGWLEPELPETCEYVWLESWSTVRRRMFTRRSRSTEGGDSE